MILSYLCVCFSFYFIYYGKKQGSRQQSGRRRQLRFSYLKFCNIYCVVQGTGKTCLFSLPPYFVIVSHRRWLFFTAWEELDRAYQVGELIAFDLNLYLPVISQQLKKSNPKSTIRFTQSFCKGNAKLMINNTNPLKSHWSSSDIP